MQVLQLVFRFVFMVALSILLLNLVRNSGQTAQVINSVTGFFQSGYAAETRAGTAPARPQGRRR